MSRFTGFPAVGIGLPITANEENPSEALGQLILADDGRKFVYAKAGGSALVRGQVVQSAAEDTGDQNIAAATAVAGDAGYNTAGQYKIVTASMTVTANQYAGGYVCVTVTPGLATYYRIASHAAFTAAAATFLLEDQLQVTLTTSSRLDFIPNPFNGVIVNPTTASSSVAGVVVSPISASQYGWLQVAGPCPVTNDAAGALTVGVGVMASSSVAGSVRLQVAGQKILGQAMSGIAASEVGMVFLNIL